ncbi:MAG: glycosyltransferase family 4 protein, partial [Planctomycetales bacterium]
PMSKPLRVAHIARNPNTGVASVISALVRAQKLRGLDVSIVLLKSAGWVPPRLIRDLPCPVHSSPYVFGTAAFAYHTVCTGRENWSRSVLDSERPLVLHYHNAWLSGALMLKNRLPGVVQLVTYHGLASDEQLKRQPLRRAIHGCWARRVERQAHAIVSVDAATPDSAANLFGVDSQRFVHIPNGTPPIDFCAPNANKTDNQIVVGHIGLIDEVKGWRITAEAVDRARTRGVNAMLVMAGDGPDADEAKAWCQARPDYCYYLGWVDNVAQDVLPKIDVLAMASRTEGMPMAALEAVSVGMPVVCTKVGGLPEVIRHGMEGLLVERNPESFTSAIVSLGRAPDVLQRMRHNCRQRWSDHFTDKIMEARYYQLYLDTLAGAKQSQSGELVK